MKPQRGLSGRGGADAEFQAEALKAKKLKDIRIELSYIPAPFKEETFNFPVSIISK